MRHVLTSQQFDRSLIERLCHEADHLRVLMEEPNDRCKSLAGKMMITVFYEPSTRTRISFEAAASHLGIRVVSTENAREFSSAAKGETLEDTIRVLCSYRPDVIVLRHFETGAAERAAAVSDIPIINAGDGMGQHPTQALLDLYTIRRELGRLDDLSVVIGGDLAHGRTARSLAYLLGKFRRINITFIAPSELQIGSDITDYLQRKNVQFEKADSLLPALRRADVVYWTRIQKERAAAATSTDNPYVIGRNEIAQMQHHAVIMHPLPRTEEINPEIDSDPRAAYFRQTANGLYIRMALLAWVLDRP